MKEEKGNSALEFLSGFQKPTKLGLNVPQSGVDIDEVVCIKLTQANT